MVLDALKKRLHDAANKKGGKWIKELPNALGSEAILPADVIWESSVVEQYDEGISEDNRRVDIDGLEEAHFPALV
jgi:hypothetical protein